MKYYLMNKNRTLVSFETTEEYGVSTIRNEKALGGPLPFSYIDINTWIERRNYTKHKEHLKNWLKEWGLDTTDGFLQITHALGLNDTFWVKPAGSGLTWEKVNLYDNEFTDVSCKTAFETGLFGLQLSTTTPEFTTEGTFPKCWIKDEEGIHILKQGLSGASNVGLEPYCEYISSNIAAVLGKELLPVVEYGLKLYKGKLCSCCDLFTSENTGFVPFGRLADIRKTYTLPELIRYFDENTPFGETFRSMILLDSIVFNHDRHLNNFGFLFDTDSLEIEGFAPLFDYNYSFLCSLTMEDLKDYRESLVKYDIEHKLGGDFDTVGAALMTDKFRDLLPAYIEIPRHPKYNMDEDRMRLLEDIFQENYAVIRNGRRTIIPAKAADISGQEDNLPITEKETDKEEISPEL